jgi:hypothetical protein
LPVSNGGTGAATFAANNVLLGNGTSAFQVVAPGTAGNVLTSDGTTWQSSPGGASGVSSVSFSTTGLTPSTATTGAITVAGTLVAANGGTGQSTYTDGDLLYASGATALSKLADVATGNALISGGVGVAPSYGKIGLTTHVSGTLAVGNGGTGLTVGTSGGVPYFSATNTLTSSAVLAANAIVVGGGAGASPATVTTGTGVVTALGQNVTGSGGIALATSPSFTTPTLGAATATSVNKVAITAPATSATLTLADGKTVTLNNSLTFSGTDSTTMTFPTTSATIARTDAAQTFSGTQTFGGSVVPATNTVDSVGYTGMPQNAQSAAYTLVAGDAGKTVVHPITDNNAQTFTIPANGTVAYPVGTTITFVNMINTVTIAITTDTMYLAGAGTTGSRTLAAYGVASAIKVTSTSWIISGNGLT